MDLDYIKSVYNMYKDIPGGLESYVTRRLMEEVLKEPETKDVHKVAVKKDDVKVVFHWNDEGRIIDMEFVRIR